ncbi:MAG: hypothetical protein JWO25_2549 [Alphaproteobacteria bacterium]|nr:hypothetical protein [Alphaproteobacteria bacterium]MDB5722897.1 hypothetical protein [Alphaproteobacteria bacterium]
MLRPLYWSFPWLALLALVLSILALLIALQRRDGPERKREPTSAPIPGIGQEAGDGGLFTLVPMADDDHDFERRAGLAGLTATDRQLLAFLDARSDEMRRVLCTLARMGVAWRRAETDRARTWLHSVEPHPFYKGGQVLFDLLEWEDFMLDGPQATADANEVGTFLRHLAEWVGLPPPGTHITGNLPPLEPGFYLYRDVVLGAIAAAVAAFPQS